MKRLLFDQLRSLCSLSTLPVCVVALSLLIDASLSFAQSSADPWGQRAAPNSRPQGWEDASSVEPQPVLNGKEAQADGRLSLRSYLSGDSSQTYDTPTISISFLETDLRGRNLTNRGLSLDLDATFILDISQANERRFGETERLDQVRQLYVGRAVGRLDLFAGRRLIHNAGNAWVDGLEARLNLDQRRLSIGAYGGLSPDRFDRSLTLDYQAGGGYIDVHREGLDLSLAYNTLFYQGALDRHYLYQRSHFKVLSGLFISDYLILDLIDGPEVTTLLSTIDFSPTKSLNFALNLSQYSLERYRNQVVYRNIIEPNQALILGNEVVDLVYRRVRLSASMQVTDDWYHYQMIEYKTRTQDGAEAKLYTIGLRAEDLIGSGVELDAQVQVMNQFRSDSLIFALTARKDVSTHWSVDARLTRFNGRTLDQNTDRLRIFDEAQSIYLFGASLIARPSKHHRLTALYDGVYESELNDLKSDEALMIHTGMFKYSYLF